MTTIDLSVLTKNEIPSLIGWNRGERARVHFGLEALDSAADAVVVQAPADLRTLTPSFVQGFLGDSLLKLGEPAFRRHYVFTGFSQSARDSLELGINRILMQRAFDDAAA